MSEHALKLSLLARLRWWLYARCFAYCIHCVDPAADPAEFELLDTANFIAMSKDEAREIMEEAPDVAWRLEGLLLPHRWDDARLVVETVKREAMMQ